MSTPASKAYVLSFGGYLVDDLTVSPTLRNHLFHIHNPVCGDYTLQAQ